MLRRSEQMKELGCRVGATEGFGEQCIIWGVPAGSLPQRTNYPRQKPSQSMYTMNGGNT